MKIEHAVEMTQHVMNQDNHLDVGWVQQTRTWYEHFYTREEADKRIAEFNADTTSHIKNTAKYYKEVRSKDIHYRVSGVDLKVRLDNFEGPNLNDRGHISWVMQVIAEDFYDNYYLEDEHFYEQNWPFTFTILRDGEPDINRVVDCEMVPKFYISEE